jgi:hypothetical protein
MQKGIMPVAAAALCAALLVACDAHFTDLRRPVLGTLADGGGSADGGAGVELDGGAAATPDGGGADDGGPMSDGGVAAGNDGGAASDAGVPDAGAPQVSCTAGGAAPIAAAGESILAQGCMTGRAGHAGRGLAALVRRADGEVSLRFGTDFSVSAVPGPVVVLSTRDSLGTSLQPGQGDQEIAVLLSASGVQSYRVPGGDAGRRYAWVFCKPFGVEVARATLVSVP